LFEAIILGRKHNPILWTSIGLLTALTCVARTTHITSPNTIDWYAQGEKVTIEGTIADEPDRRPLQTKYTIKTKSVTDKFGTKYNGIQGNVLITDQRQWPLFEYRDLVSVSGILEKPEPIETFQYDNYLSRFDIYSVMYRGSISSENTANTQHIKRHLYALKTSFESQINRLYPEPHASFMAGLLTGSRKGIPEGLMQDFTTTGLTHIIAISGYNISIIIVIIHSMLFWMPPKLRYGSAVTCIIIFTIFVGANAAVVRAAIMGILGLTALQVGRKTTALLSVLWTALFMVAWNPKILWYDAGFQLSFLAVIGLIEISPLLEKYMKRVPQTLAIRESLTMTIAAQIAATPFIISMFGTLSLIAPLTNIMVAPALPIAMLLGATGILISYVSMPFGLLISYGGWLTLEWIIAIAKIGAHIPGASLNMHIPAIILCGYYIILITTIRRGRSSSSLESTELPVSAQVSSLGV